MVTDFYPKVKRRRYFPDMPYRLEKILKKEFSLLTKKKSCDIF